MKLKYYLRGLGLGLIVAALVMGLHYGKSSTMTDAQIKERAAELGMVENTTLTDASDDSQSAQELLDSMNSAKTEEDADSQSGTNGSDLLTEDDKTASENDNIEAAAEDEETADPTDEDNAGQDLTEDKVSVQTETVTDASDDPDRTENLTGDAASEENLTAGSSSSDAGTGIDAGSKSDTSETKHITVSSGDSSYTVAQKLASAGLVPDAAEYDAYLCNNGYDRYIRTGTYDISTDDSNADIARKITGR